MHDLRDANNYYYTIYYMLCYVLCHDRCNYLEKKVIHEQITLLIWATVFQNSNLNIFHCLQLELGGTSTENVINNNSLNIYATYFISPFYFLLFFPIFPQNFLILML
ncbi:hypothetical protein PanWU01x14_077670 [Parasponia andersonii]|uniref:Uncharacterized protein n=1 Tax=Parasponia andersonii TaxID=3476 RepID=A0A2P5DBR8_PARAD|nr:hypothetical protein PanWU01x14_077670 [Parasponia andersonii]